MSGLMAIEMAAYEALSAPSTVSAPIFQHVPQDPDGILYPLVVLHDLENIEPIGLGGDGDIRGELAILVMTEGEERLPCIALIEEIRIALDGKTFLAAGFRVSFVQTAASVSLAEDGLGYSGLAIFTVFALGD